MSNTINAIKACDIVEALYPNLPNSKEYRESIENIFRNTTYNKWSEPKYKCPECDGGMCRNEMEVCASYPPKYEYRCNKCGHVEYQRG